MIRALLALFDLGRPALELCGVDYPRFRAILELKLTLDTLRHAPAHVLASRRKPHNALLVTILMYTLLGAFAAFFVLRAGSPLVAFTFVHSVIMAMIAISLISDFSSVLLDSADHEILAPRPITPRTLLAARLAHIAVYLTLLTLSLALFPLVAGWIVHGAWLPPVFVASLVPALMLVVALVVVLYLGVMRVFDEEKLRDAVLYVQVLAAVGVVGGYQLLPRLVDVRRLESLEIAGRSWIYLYPPAWFAAPIDLLAGNSDAPRWILSLLALTLPLLALATVLRLGSGFRIAPDGVVQQRIAAAARRRWVRRLGSLTARPGAERAAFEWTWHLSGRNRSFKLRTYPGIAILFVLVVLFLLADARDAEDVRRILAELPGTERHLLLLYFAVTALPATIAELRFSDRPEAAWVYRIVPLRRPGPALMGGLKAVTCRFVLPGFLAISAFVVAVWGPRALPDVLLAGCVGLLALLMYALALGRRALPFSLPMEILRRSGLQVRLFGFLALAALSGGAHWVLRSVPGGVPAAAFVVLGVVWLLARRYRATSWEAIRSPG